MSNPMRLVAAIAVIAVAGFIALNLRGGSSGVGGVSSPSTGTPSASASTPSAPASPPSIQPSPTPITATWITYVSNRYGFSIGRPADWTVRPAANEWSFPADADFLTAASEGFIGPGQSILATAWSVAVKPGTTAAAWLQTYCPKTTTPCTGIQSRTIAATMDGHAGIIVPFTNDVEAFILVNNRMYVVAEWRPDVDQTTAPFGSGTLLIEDFLSTMHLLPGGPAPSATP